MKIKIEEVNSLIKEKFRDNKTFFADTLKLNPCFVSQILKGKRNPTSSKMCTAIIEYCDKNSLNYKNYISF